MSSFAEYVYDGAIWRNEVESGTFDGVNGASPGLWFKMPANILNRKRKAFAHYFGHYPRSIDNADKRSNSYYVRQYLNPNGENKKHAAYGGWLRNAPIFRRRDPSSSWKLNDCAWEIRTAMAAGIDGFFVDIMGPSGGSWNRYINLRDAAHRLDSGFKVVPMLDGNGATVRSGDAALAANRVAQFAHRKSSYYLPDGRYLLSCFKIEAQSSRWWAEVFRALKRNHGLDAAFIGVALNFSSLRRYNTELSSRWYLGEGRWSYGADPGIIRAKSNEVAASHRRGAIAMSPIIGQNSRPYSGTYDEALNTKATRTSWRKAIKEKADYVQLVTWNDFSECSEIVPSEAKGYAALDLNSWYLVKWKTGRFPKIRRDAIIISHRSSFVKARPSGPQRRLMTQKVAGRGTSRPRDIVEAVTFLVAPAKVTLQVGRRRYSYVAPRGAHVRRVPLGVGKISGRVARGKSVTASVRSTVTVVRRPTRDDKQYYWFSSAR